MGQSSFRKDQEKLVQGEEGPDAADLRGAPTRETEAGDRSAPAPKELVDILICTPGTPDLHRSVSHSFINRTRTRTTAHIAARVSPHTQDV